MNFKNIDLYEKYKYLLEDNNDEIDYKEYTDNYEKQNLNKVDSDKKSKLTKFKENFKDVIDSEDFSEIGSNFDFQISRIIGSVLNSIRKVQNKEKYNEYGDENERNPLYNMDTEVTYPTLLYKNPRYTEDEEEALRNGTFYEPEYIIKIQIKFPNIKFSITDEMSLKTSSISKEKNFNIITDMENWEEIVYDNKNYYYADDEDIFVLIYSDRILKKDEINAILLSGNNSDIKYKFYGKSLKKFIDQYKSISENSVRKRTLKEAAREKAEDFIPYGNSIFKYEKSKNKENSEVFEILKLVLRRFLNDSGYSLGYEDEYLNHFLSAYIATCSETKYNKNITDMKLIWTKPKVDNDFQIWSEPYGGWDRTNKIENSGYLISNLGNKLKLNNLETLEKWGENEKINEFYNIVEKEILNRFPITENNAETREHFARLSFIINGFYLANNSDFKISEYKEYDIIFKTFSKVTEILLDGKSEKAYSAENKVYLFNGTPIDNSSITIDHIDGSHANNRVDNLRLSDTASNAKYSAITAKYLITITPTESLRKIINEGGIINQSIKWELESFNGNEIYPATRIKVNDISYPLTMSNDYRIKYNGKEEKLYTVSGETITSSDENFKGITEIKEKTCNITDNCQLLERIYFITINGKRIEIIGIENFKTKLKNYYKEDGSRLTDDEIEKIALSVSNKIGGNDFGLLNNVFDFNKNVTENNMTLENYYFYLDKRLMEGKSSSDENSGDDDSMPAEVLRKMVPANKNIKELINFLYTILKEEKKKNQESFVIVPTVFNNCVTITLGNRPESEKTKKLISSKDNWKGGKYYSRAIGSPIKNVKAYSVRLNDTVQDKMITSEPVISVLGQAGIREIKNGSTDSKIRTRIETGKNKQMLNNGYPTFKLDFTGEYCDFNGLLNEGRTARKNDKKVSSLFCHIVSASSWDPETLVRKYNEISGKENDGKNLSLVVHHINGCKYDFRPDNLEWVTSADNTLFDEGNGVGLFRVSPKTGLELPICVWKTEAGLLSYAKKYIKVTDTNVEPNLNVNLPTSRDSLKEVMTKVSFIHPETANNNNDFKYILRRVVLKQDDYALKNEEQNDIKENIKYIIGYEHSEIIKENNEVKTEYISGNLDDGGIVFPSTIDGFNDATKLNLYLKGRINFKSLAFGNIDEDSDEFYNVLANSALIKDIINQPNIGKKAQMLMGRGIKTRILPLKMQKTLWNGVTNRDLLSVKNKIDLGSYDIDIFSIEIINTLYEYENDESGIDNFINDKKLRYIYQKRQYIKENNYLNNALKKINEK